MYETHIIVLICRTPHFVSTLSILVKYRNHLASLTENLYLKKKKKKKKKKGFKKSKNLLPIFPQKYGLISFTLLNCKQFRVLKISKFEFKVTVHYGLWKYSTQLLQ